MSEGAKSGRPPAPLITYITDTPTIGEEELFRRLARLGRGRSARTGDFAVQLRDPGRSGGELLSFAERLRARTHALGGLLFVNDRVDVALLAGADGAHLGRRSIRIEDARRFLGPKARISVACHSVAEVLDAAKAGADLCTLSPIFASPGKGEPIGVEPIRQARSRLSRLGLDIGIIALGGVDSRSAALALESGADGVAAIRAEIDPSILAPERHGSA